MNRNYFSIFAKFIAFLSSGDITGEPSYPSYLPSEAHKTIISGLYLFMANSIYSFHIESPPK